MNKKIVITGAILVTAGIILGALGAHALKEILSAEKLASFETGIRYQLFHGLALVVLGTNADRLIAEKVWSTRLMLIGTLLFSLSIYLLALQKPMGIELKFLGPVTPLGGVLMITGWVLFIKNLLSSKQ